MDAVELELQEAATRAFILADAEDLVLVRSTRVADGSGGWTYTTPVQLATQTARLIPQSDRVLEVVSSDGRRAIPEWVLLMEPGSDMKRYDRFTWKGIVWEIAEVHYKPDYEMKGDVIRYA
jgi:hypothetical protein